MKDVEQTNKLTDLLNERFPDAQKNESGVYTIYSSTKEEYSSLKYGVALRNISHYGILKLSGNDTLDFLHRISTNAVKNLDNLQNIGTLFINEKGRFIDRTTLLRFDNDVLLVGNGTSINKLSSWINRFIVTEDIKIDKVNDRWMLMEVIGPQAESYMTLICGDILNSLTDNNIITVDVESLKFFVLKRKEPKGINKYWILSYSVIEDKVMEYFLDQKSVFDLSLVGEDAYNIFRIKKGIPASPNEINDSFNPHEANLMEEVCDSKGCYIGQEVIARLESYDKVQRELTGIIFDEDVELSDTLGIYDSQKNEIGSVTSIAKSELADEIIGLGYIRKSYVQNGSDIFVTDGKTNCKIKLTTLPIE